MQPLGLLGKLQPDAAKSGHGCSGTPVLSTDQCSKQEGVQHRDVVPPHCTCLDPGLVEQMVSLKVNLSLLRLPKLQVQMECTHSVHTYFLFSFFKKQLMAHFQSWSGHSLHHQ